LAGKGGHACLLEAARRIAEAQIDIVRIRRARHDLLARKLKESSQKSEASSPAPDLRSSVKRVLELIEPIEPDSPFWSYKQMFYALEDKSPGEKRDDTSNKPKSSQAGPNMLLIEIPEEFTLFDRYERRALSRRKFAIREMDAIRLEP
jgi:hypothetical protein